MPYIDSAGVKLNKNADLIIEADASGAVTSCRDAVTGAEYVGGGASNIVSGTFTTGSETDVIESIAIPYSGVGYPVSGVFVADGGPQGSTVAHQRGVVAFNFIKNYAATEPSYENQANIDTCQSIGVWRQDDSTTSAVSRTATAPNLFSASFPSTVTAANSLIMTSANNIQIKISASGTYGWVPSTTYHYVIVYSE